jgi:hypothetical protein
MRMDKSGGIGADLATMDLILSYGWYAVEKE